MVIDMEDLFLNSNIRTQVPSISLNDAEAVLKRGLRYFLGDNAQWLPEYDQIAKWLTDNNHKGLMATGQNGRGKTLLCYQVMQMVFRHYLKLEYYNADAIDLAEDYEIWRRKYDMLESDMPIFLDDVGAESMAVAYGMRHDIFAEIVDKAEKRKRLLIFTTNLSAEEIRERYGIRILDRLHALTTSVAFKGDSLRK